MRLLAFDTCLDKTYVTLFNDSKYINRVILSDAQNYHSAYLMSTIVELLKEEKLTPLDIDCIATDIGPGSFTGIRACVTVARMLAQQLGKKVVGVSSLEILSKILGGDHLVALDARKNKAYLFDGEIKGAIELEEVDAIVAGKELITDNSLYERFAQCALKVTSYQHDEFPLGEILARIALEKLQSGSDFNWQDLKPLYIQPPPVFK